MLKQLKPDELYFVIRINENYAKEIFEVLKKGQIANDDWPEGEDITFEEWVFDTFGNQGLEYINPKI
jgi:protoporphyrinogen oxidase